jgi:iron complex transport system substrate-binding protein
MRSLRVLRGSAIVHAMYKQCSYPLLLLAAAVLLTGCGRHPQAPQAVDPAEDIRIASLAPNVTEIICAIGGADFLVCRSSTCDYPHEVTSTLPIAGGFGTPSLEALTAARPTLVLETDLADESLTRIIQKLGLRRERLPSANVADILASITRAGELIGHTNQAAILVAEINQGLEAYRAHAPAADQRPRIYIEIWNDPPVTAGKGSFVSDLVTIAGGINIGDSVNRDYFNISAEWVIEQDPDIMLAVYMDTKENSVTQFNARPGWSELRALKNGNVFAGQNSDVLLRPGPRLLEGVEIIHTCIAAAK